jgi:hypothetical protein
VASRVVLSSVELVRVFDTTRTTSLCGIILVFDPENRGITFHRNADKRLVNFTHNVPGNTILVQLVFPSVFYARIFFVIQFYLQSVPVHSANCVKDVYSGM